MGVFRTVLTVLACTRCREAREVDVQFKTGCDGLEVYREGEVVSEIQPLPFGGAYRGIVERYCPLCLRDWEADAARAYGENLAELIEEGRLRLAREGEARELLPQELRELGERRAAELAAMPLHDGPKVYETRLGIHEFAVTWDDRRLGVTGADRWEFDDTVQDRVDRTMKTRGWEHGAEPFEQPDVFLDVESRVRVRRRS
jgi:hypothetical protein